MNVFIMTLHSTGFIHVYKSPTSRLEYPFKDEPQTALFKDPVCTAQ